MGGVGAAPGGGTASPSIIGRKAAASTLSNWRRFAAQKKAMPPMTTNSTDNGINSSRMLTIRDPLAQRDGGLRQAIGPAPIRRLFSTTSKELADMPMAASQGGTNPIAASGTALKL